MFLVKDGNFDNVRIPTYYIEDSSELSSIPSNAPAGTLVQCNKTGNFQVFMKNTAGDFNPL